MFLIGCHSTAQNIYPWATRSGNDRFKRSKTLTAVAKCGPESLSLSARASNNAKLPLLRADNSPTRRSRSLLTAQHAKLDRRFDVEQVHPLRL